MSTRHRNAGGPFVIFDPGLGVTGSLSVDGALKIEESGGEGRAVHVSGSMSIMPKFQNGIGFNSNFRHMLEVAQENQLDAITPGGIAIFGANGATTVGKGYGTLGIYSGSANAPRELVITSGIHGSYTSDHTETADIKFVTSGTDNETQRAKISQIPALQVTGSFQNKGNASITGSLVVEKSATSGVEWALHTKRGTGAHSAYQIKIENADASGTAAPYWGLFHQDDGEFTIGEAHNDYKLQIKPDGKIGIGTQTPSSQLHIAAVGSFSDSVIRIGERGSLGTTPDTSNVAQARLELIANEDSGAVKARFDAIDSSGGKYVLLGAYSSHDLKFSTSNVERMALTSTGLGIGVSDPDQKLEVAGAIHVSGEIASPAAPADGDGGILYVKSDGKPYWVSNEVSEIDLSAVSANATTVTVTDNESTDEFNKIIFGAGGAGSGDIGLEADGDLTYNPSTGLLTTPQLTVNSISDDPDDLAIRKRSNSAGADLVLRRDATNGTLLDNQIIGRVRFQATEENNSNYTVGAAVIARTADAWDRSGGSCPADLEFWTTPSSATATTQKMTILADGKVGIGYTGTDIDHKLTVNGNVKFGGSLALTHASSAGSPQLRIHESDAGYGRLEFQNTADTNGPNSLSHEWTLAGLPKAQGSQADARFNIFYGDQDGSGGGADLLSATGKGNILMPYTCFVSAYPSVDIGPISTGGSDPVFNGEHFDNQGAYDASTGVFTAPVTGYYLSNLTIALESLDADINYLWIGVISDGTPTYGNFCRIHGKEFSADTDSNPLSRSASTIFKLAAGDTLKITAYQSGGAEQIKISGTLNGSLSVWQIRLIG